MARIPPKSVSKSDAEQLRNLEAELSAPVLEPHGRGVRLTPHGQAMFSKAKSVLDAYAGFQSDQADIAVAGAPLTNGLTSA